MVSIGGSVFEGVLHGSTYLGYAGLTSTTKKVCLYQSVTCHSRNAASKQFVMHGRWIPMIERVIFVQMTSSSKRFQRNSTQSLYEIFLFLT